MRSRTWVLLAIGGAASSLALTASATQHPNFAAGVMFAAAAPTAPGGSRPLAIDNAAAGRAAQSRNNVPGRLVDTPFIVANKAAINSISIPVLLPGEFDLVAHLRLFPNGAFYTVSSTSNGMSFVLTGAGRAFPIPPATMRGLPKGQLSSRIPPDGIVIEQTEAGIDASFSRFGAAYTISLECAKIRADPRCGSEAYIRGVIGRLIVAPKGA